MQSEIFRLGIASGMNKVATLGLEKWAQAISYKGLISYLREPIKGGVGREARSGFRKITPQMAKDLGVSPETLQRAEQAAARLEARAAGKPMPKRGPKGTRKKEVSDPFADIPTSEIQGRGKGTSSGVFRDSTKAKPTKAEGAKKVLEDAPTKVKAKPKGEPTEVTKAAPPPKKTDAKPKPAAKPAEPKPIATKTQQVPDAPTRVAPSMDQTVVQPGRDQLRLVQQSTPPSQPVTRGQVVSEAPVQQVAPAAAQPAVPPPPPQQMAQQAAQQVQPGQIVSQAPAGPLPGQVVTQGGAPIPPAPPKPPVTPDMGDIHPGFTPAQQAAMQQGVHPAAPGVAPAMAAPKDPTTGSLTKTLMAGGAGLGVGGAGGAYAMMNPQQPQQQQPYLMKAAAAARARRGKRSVGSRFMGPDLEGMASWSESAPARENAKIENPNRGLEPNTSAAPSY